MAVAVDAPNERAAASTGEGVRGAASTAARASATVHGVWPLGPPAFALVGWAREELRGAVLFGLVVVVEGEVKAGARHQAAEGAKGSAGFAGERAARIRSTLPGRMGNRARARAMS